eukprot:6277139-Amphidinium_carterae.1
MPNACHKHGYKNQRELRRKEWLNVEWWRDEDENQGNGSQNQSIKDPTGPLNRTSKSEKHLTPPLTLQTK